MIMKLTGYIQQLDLRFGTKDDNDPKDTTTTSPDETTNNNNNNTIMKTSSPITKPTTLAQQAPVHSVNQNSHAKTVKQDSLPQTYPELQALINEVQLKQKMEILLIETGKPLDQI